MNSDNNRWLHRALLCTGQCSKHRVEMTDLIPRETLWGVNATVMPILTVEQNEAVLNVLFKFLLKLQQLMFSFTCSLFPQWTRGHWALGTAPRWRGQDAHSEEAFAHPAPLSLHSILVTSPPDSCHSCHHLPPQFLFLKEHLMRAPE